jgi:pimeloyl-ACP methyl ester carboxylesterase
MLFVYILAGLLGLAVAASLAAGYAAYRMALTRQEKHPELQEPDEKAKIRIDANNAGKEYLFSLNPEDVTLRSFDGLELKGYFLPAARPSDKLAVLVHGYTCTGPNEFGGFLRFYHEELNYNVLLPDHRCHGRSAGKRIGFAALEWRDILDWADAFAKRLGPDTQVVLHGTSMGGATVMNCNAHNPPGYIKCVVEDCGYTNGYEMLWLAARRDLKLNIPPVMWALAMWYRVFTGKSLRRDSDPYGNIGRFKAPTLFIHGAADPFVPAEMGLRCYEAATAPKDLLLVDGAAHAMAYFIGREEYEAKLREWYARWMDATSSCCTSAHTPPA